MRLLALLCLALAGCSTAQTWDAPAFVKVEGRSMLPYVESFKYTRRVTFIGAFPYERLEPGMVANRRGGWGDTLHALKSYDPKTDSWVMQGTYNAKPDPWPLTRKNYIGVVPGLRVPLVFPAH